MSITQFPNIGQGIQAQLLALTPQTGVTTHNLNPGFVVMVIEHSGGSQVRYRGSNTIPADYYVTETPAQIAALTPLISLTQLITVANSSTQRQFAFYTPPQNICEPYDVGTDYYLTLHHNFHGKQETIQVAESSATVIAAIAAALPSGGGGGTTTQTVTAAGGNQATATATTASIIRITGGTGGIRLDGGTPGERRWVHNVTSAQVNVYPAAGEFIEPGLVIVPVTLGAGQSVEFVCDLAGRWSRERVINTTSITCTGTTQGGGVAVPQGVDVVLARASVGNTAATLFTVSGGSCEITIKNTGSAAMRLYPASGQQIGTLGVDAFYTVGVGRSVRLRSDVTGAWIDTTSQIDVLAANSLSTVTTGGILSVLDASGLGIATLSSQGIVHQVGTDFAGEGLEATAGGNQSNGAPIATNRFTITACATEGDSCVITGTANIVTINNAGVASSYVYCPVGHTMDGTLNGYCVVPAGAKTLVQLDADGTSWLSTQLPRQTVSTTATLVAGEFTFNATNLGAGIAGKITASSFVRVNGISALNATPSVGVRFRQTVIAATSIVIQAYDETGAADNADVSTVLVEVVI